MSIPKTIHYCWFGNGVKNETIVNCIKSWYAHLPDYNIIEWNDNNCEFTNAFCRQALLHKQWAFLSDYIRLKVLYQYGGIYLDTDMLVFKSFNPLVQNQCFFGYQDNGEISGGIIGCVKGNEYIGACLAKYEQMQFNPSRLMSMAFPLVITGVYQGFNQKEQVTIYPYTYFYPFLFNDSLKGINYLDSVKPESYAVHLWNSSWFNDKILAGFAFERGKYLKGVRLLLNYLYKNPKVITSIPSILIRKIVNMIKK